MGYRLIKVKSYTDHRGTLLPTEGEGQIPFAIKRVFFLKNLNSRYQRANHANMDINEVILTIHGRCKVRICDGRGKDVVISLDNPEQALFVSKGMWRELFAFSNDCILAVLADRHYDKKGYIRDYGLFEKTVRYKARRV